MAPMAMRACSVADVDVNGPFSRFPGVQRWFAVLEGAGVVLTIGSKEHPLGPDDDAIAFRGDAAVRCRLVDGPTRDLNLMLSGVPGAMRRVVPGEPWRPEACECGLYATRAGHCDTTGRRRTTCRADGRIAAGHPGGRVIVCSEGDGSKPLQCGIESDRSWWMGAR